jgi:hypothetical protein
MDFGWLIAVFAIAMIYAMRSLPFEVAWRFKTFTIVMLALAAFLQFLLVELGLGFGVRLYRERKKTGALNSKGINRFFENVRAADGRKELIWFVLIFLYLYCMARYLEIQSLWLTEFIKFGR